MSHWKDVCREKNGPDVCDSPGCSRCIAEAARRMTERVLDCPSCDGKGVEQNVGPIYTCMQCGGTGEVDADGFMVVDDLMEQS